GGGHWTDLPDPCGATRFPGGLWGSISAAPAGQLWAVCAGQPAAGTMPKDLVASNDGGVSWTVGGQVEESGYGTRVYPVSATTAWRTGARADIFRTTDGAQWRDVAKLDSNGPRAFVAIDALTAAYVYDSGDGLPIHVTTDGGATWQSYAGG